MDMSRTMRTEDVFLGFVSSFRDCKVALCVQGGTDDEF